MPPESDLNLGKTLLLLSEGMLVFSQRFELIKHLGRGAMGTVWKAYDRVLDKTVALKFLPETIAIDEASILDFKRETRQALDLTHPNIVRVYDFHSDDRMAGISMEYVEGKTLAAVRARSEGGRIKTDKIPQWFFQILQALEYAHNSAKLVHRDIKPSNIMVTSEGILKITDFGISASINENVTRVTKQSHSAGTPSYMSPQQINGEPPQIEDDIYSLGATFYELLTGKPPFYSGDILHQVINSNPIPIVEKLAHARSSIDWKDLKEWDTVIGRCLSKEANERPGVTELLQETKGSSGSHGLDLTPSVHSRKTLFLIPIIICVGLILYFSSKFRTQENLLSDPVEQGSASGSEQNVLNATFTPNPIPSGSEGGPAAALAYEELGNSPALLNTEPLIYDLPNDFGVTLDTANGKRTFYSGDQVEFTFSSTKDCFLALFYYQPNGDCTLLYPNLFSASRMIGNNLEYTIPDSNRDEYKIIAVEPFGVDTIYAVACTTMSDLMSLIEKKLNRADTENKSYLQLNEDSIQEISRGLKAVHEGKLSTSPKSDILWSDAILSIETKM